MKNQPDDGLDARVLPHSLEAERAVLGASLLFPEMLAVAMSAVTPAQFFRDAHRRIFQTMLDLSGDRVAVDLVTVKNRLATLGTLDAVGGPAYLASMTDGVPRSMNVDHYAAIVREKATLRGLIHAGTKMIAAAYDGQDPTGEILETAQRDLFTVSDGSVVGGGFVDARALMVETFDELERRMADTREFTGVPSGFYDLDRLTGGFQPGDLIFIAARPSMGKTSLLQSLAIHAATVGGVEVGLFSVEMSRTALALRMLASEAGVDSLRVRDGKLSQGEWGKLSLALARLSDSRLHVDDSPDLTVFDVRAKARKLQAQHGLGLILIDYLQLMRVSERGENRNLEVAGMSRGLKTLARDLNIPVIVLSQLSRDADRRADHRPNLSDLRDSGSLEQDADLVLFPYREEVYAPTPENRGVAEIIVGKQRNGPTGVVRLSWFEHLTRFENFTARAMRA